MKRLLAVMVVLSTMFISQRLSAQVDFSYISDGDSISKLTAIFGQPIDRFEHEWGNDETYVTVKFTGCTATVCLQDNHLEGLIFWTSDISLLASVVSGGIKVGDNISKFKDIDFSKEVTGEHYEPAGFIPLRSPFRCHSSAKVNYNYEILGRAEPFSALFATEDGIIREIMISHPDDAYNPNEGKGPEIGTISGTL